MRSLTLAPSSPEIGFHAPAPARLVELRPAPPASPPPLWLVLAAFAAVYLIWGSTFFAIRVAVETLPPFLMAGARFFLAGAALYAFLRARGAEAPAGAVWKSNAVIGALLLPLGNGALSWAERTVPSSLCALMIAAVPLWMIIADWLRPGGHRPRPGLFAGLALGFLGVLLIALGRDPQGQRTMSGLGAAILLAAPASWALGSIYSRHAPRSPSALLNVALQMLCGGVLMLGLGLLFGETRGFHLGQVSLRSGVAFLYLATFGSLIGFTAYVWLLQVSTPARVSTYAYVNPFIAVLLGASLLHEPLSPFLALAGTLILGAVFFLTTPDTNSPHRPRTHPAPLTTDAPCALSWTGQAVEQAWLPREMAAPCFSPAAPSPPGPEAPRHRRFFARGVGVAAVPSAG